jgi:hypothetical protein
MGHRIDISSLILILFVSTTQAFPLDCQACHATIIPQQFTVFFQNIQQVGQMVNVTETQTGESRSQKDSRIKSDFEFIPLNIHSKRLTSRDLLPPFKNVYSFLSPRPWT